MAGTVRPGIDPGWLDHLYLHDPADHALAVWDTQVWPEMVEFHTLFEDTTPAAYLLGWHGLPECPVLHWHGQPADPAPLLATFPRRPFLAIVPPELREPISARHAPVRLYPLHLRRRPAAPPPAPPEVPVRRLGRGDLEELRRLANEDHSSVTETYLTLDPERDWVAGAFEGHRLVAVARAEVRLPRIWHVSGVYTHPDRRGRGYARSAVGAVLGAAYAEGASTALFVRDDNEPARRLYDRLGFEPGTARTWIDAGANRVP